MEASNVYKLRASLLGHSKDVRCVGITLRPEGCIVSGSRDMTARFWKPNLDGDVSFTALEPFRGHAGFVSSVCITPPEDDYPEGVILTGCNDGIIRAFVTKSSDPVYKLTGHSSTVSTLTCGKFGVVVSGSWDLSVRVWAEGQCQAVLTGHDLAVWDVATIPGQNSILSASADKTIKLWEEGSCKMTYKGHTDCVRGLAVLSTTDFLSCANDATIRHWHIKGSCLQEFHGHTNYIYSIAILPNGIDFVTSAEDRTVRVWKGGECSQTIYLPAQSIWSVACLPNGDIVAGCSDGAVRVFSAVPERHAPPQTLAAFEEEVASITVAAQQELGGMKVSDLPGPEALLAPGNRDGQTKMVRDGTNVTCHSWDSARQEWVKVGDVVGASGSASNESGKKMYEGKAYDYVFTISLEDNKPELQLPYNVTEDPWHVAQKFIHKHDLSQYHLEQIANFIIDNTKGITLGAEQTSSAYADPFTGGNRYIPGQATAGAAGHDPFTGGNRYVPSSESIKTTPTSSVPGIPCFPQQTYLNFDGKPNIEGILKKLHEFNGQIGDRNKVPPSELQEVVKLVDLQGAVNMSHFSVLKHLLGWPHEYMFPVLDILRLAIRNPTACDSFCSSGDSESFINLLMGFLTPSTAAPNQFLSLRTIANMFSHQTGHAFVLKHRENIMSSIMDMVPFQNRNVEIAVATVLLNFAVAFLTLPDLEAKTQCMSCLAVALCKLTDGEAVYRALVALGTLVQNDKEVTDFVKSLNLNSQLQELRMKSDLQKVRNCSAHLLEVLQ